MEAARTYRIRIAGRLSGRMASLFVPLEGVPWEGGDETVFTGQLDRHEVRRVLGLVRDLGLELVDLETAPAGPNRSLQGGAGYADWREMYRAARQAEAAVRCLRLEPGHPGVREAKV